VCAKLEASCDFEEELAARQELAHHLASSSAANGRHPHHQLPHGAVSGGRAATKCLRSVDSVFFCEILHFNKIVHFENFLEMQRLSEISPTNLRKVVFKIAL